MNAKQRLENGIADINNQLENTTDRSIRARLIRVRIDLETQLSWVMETERRFCA